MMKKVFWFLATICLLSGLSTLEGKAKAEGRSPPVWGKDCDFYKDVLPDIPYTYLSTLSRDSEINNLVNHNQEPIYTVLTINNDMFKQHENCSHPNYNTIQFLLANDSFASCQQDPLCTTHSSYESRLWTQFDNDPPEIFLVTVSNTPCPSLYFKSYKFILKLFTHERLTIQVRLKDTGLQSF
ncbi:hypothetical protein, partial [Commensalibacter sp. Nvir]|uniref:hypothetical protein n=1 Tax=Commensalibacter sp. Nvir TaxID=3069817 RepID=UPI0030C87950